MHAQHTTSRPQLNSLLWNPATQSFDVARLPPTSQPELVAFYSPGGPADRDGAAYVAPRPAHRGADSIPSGTSVQEADVPPEEPGWHAGPPVYTLAAEAWFALVSNQKHVQYLAGVPSRR